MLLSEQNNFDQVKTPALKRDWPAKIIIIAVVLSLVLGSVSGGAATLIVMKNLDKFGFVLGQNNGQATIQNVAKETVIESNLESDTIRVVKDVQPSVVSIVISKTLKQIYSSTGPTQFDQYFQFGWPFQSQQEPQIPKGQENQTQEVGGGSGFIVSADGLILTNKHVVADEQATYTVVTNDGTKYDAKVLARDPLYDLAVLKIEAKDLKPVTLGDSDNIQIGQTVIAIGNSLAQFQNSVTRGIISGINRRIEAGGNQGFSEVLETAIQTDAAINPGNSGGPLLNIKGEVIGVNTAISQSGQLLGFAIPINDVKQVIDSVQKNGKIVRPFLGVRYSIIDSQISKANNLKYDYGALISQGQTAADIAVVPGSPADKAGIVANDIILEINGQKIDDSHSLARMLAKYAPGDEVELKIFHKDGEKTVKAKLIERPEEK
ncbi:MAG: trypsin-like peptidase domain-containing protein [Candidatus Parcubacteria bacterium]|nr:trypsin-like peptidase domain-containing protein [Candidatus Parcubacteria bacterium]